MKRLGVLVLASLALCACNADEQAAPDCVKSTTAIGEVCTVTTAPDVSELERIHEAEVAEWADR